MKQLKLNTCVEEKDTCVEEEDTCVEKEDTCVEEEESSVDERNQSQFIVSIPTDYPTTKEDQDRATY